VVLPLPLRAAHLTALPSLLLGPRLLPPSNRSLTRPPPTRHKPSRLLPRRALAPVCLARWPQLPRKCPVPRSSFLFLRPPVKSGVRVKCSGTCANGHLDIVVLLSDPLSATPSVASSAVAPAPLRRPSRLLLLPRLWTTVSTRATLARARSRTLPVRLMFATSAHAWMRTRVTSAFAVGTLISWYVYTYFDLFLFTLY
jgi:hypothetical protein